MEGQSWHRSALHQHVLCGSTITVLMATGFVNGQRQILASWQMGKIKPTFIYLVFIVPFLGTRGQTAQWIFTYDGTGQTDSWKG